MKARDMDVFYVLKDPNGTLHWDTLQPHKSWCWSYGGFSTVCAQQGEGWREKYWKREKASMNAALKLGYKFQKVHLLEVPDNGDPYKAQVHKLLNEILDHQIANRGGKWPFYKCYTYASGTFPDWVAKAEAMVRND